MNKVDFTALESPLLTFEEAIKLKAQSEFERNGVIHIFEYTFELCWKSVRKLFD